MNNTKGLGSTGAPGPNNIQNKRAMIRMVINENGKIRLESNKVTHVEKLASREGNSIYFIDNAVERVESILNGEVAVVADEYVAAVYEGEIVMLGDNYVLPESKRRFLIALKPMDLLEQNKYRRLKRVETTVNDDEVTIVTESTVIKAMAAIDVIVNNVHYDKVITATLSDKTTGSDYEIAMCMIGSLKAIYNPSSVLSSSLAILLYKVEPTGNEEKIKEIIERMKATGLEIK